VQESGEIAARLQAAGLFTGAPERGTPEQGWATVAHDTMRVLRDASASDGLRMVAGHARQLFGADLGVVFVAGPGNTVAVNAAHGHGADLLRGVVRPAGELWRRMLAGEDVAVSDITLDPEVADLAGPLQLGPMLMVPLVATDRLLGALALARLRSRPAYLPAEVHSAATFAGYAALSLIWAEEYRQREERDRVADSLHDVVLGRLFATGLRLQAIPANQVGAAAPTITAAAAALDQALADIRAAIYALRPTTADLVPRS
jgi:signal transduction histidine kinase